MIETLLGGLLGGAFRLAPEILKWLDRQGERGHELAMQDKALEFEKLRGAQRMAEIGAASDAAWNVGAVEALRDAVAAQGQKSGADVNSQETDQSTRLGDGGHRTLPLGVRRRKGVARLGGTARSGVVTFAHLNSFSLSPKKWIEATGAIGLYAKAGRGGGTYAHKDIAFEFGSWLSPEFKLYLSWPRCKRAKPPSKPSNRKRPGSAPIAAPPTSSRTALPAACSAFCAVAAHAPSTR